MFPSASTFQRIQDATLRDLWQLAPEAILCAAIVLMLFCRLFNRLNRLHLGVVALGASAAAFGAALQQWSSPTGAIPSLELFGGMLINDSLSLYSRLLLAAALVLFTLLSMLTGVPDREDSADFFVMLFGAALGMMLMCQANHLMTVFITVEMASLPSYALAGFMKGRRSAGEAALKYVVYGAAASGAMLYGISLIVTGYGTGHLPTIADGWILHIHESKVDPLMLGALGLVFVGLAFKLSAVPFHFWCPDVFEGASAEVAGFLSVASKAAAVVLSARFLTLLTGPVNSETRVWMTGNIGLVIAACAALTCTLGNLAALAQSNVKRMLAYSTIAHAGYMLMALSILNEPGLRALAFYLPAYLILNLLVFACVCFLRNATGSETMTDYAGLAKCEPLLTAALAVGVFGLLGLPPIIGFAAKFQVFAALAETAGGFSRVFPFLSWVFYGLLAVAAINTLISAGYYIKLMRIMVLEPAPVDSAPRRVKSPQAAYALLLAAAALVGGVVWNPLERAAGRAAESPMQDQLKREKAYLNKS